MRDLRGDSLGHLSEMRWDVCHLMALWSAVAHLWSRELNQALLQVAERSFNQTMLRFVVLEEMVPKGMLAQNLWISQDDDTVFGTSQGDVQTTGIVQEANTLMVVGTDTRQHNVVLFSALESIDRGNFNFLVKFLLEGSVRLHRRDNV